MPGFWEHTPTVLTCTLYVETVTFAWSVGLRNLMLPGPVLGLSGMPYDHARNQGCMRALEIGADFLFFLDSDVIPPPDTVLRLMKHDLPIVSGIYCRRSPPHGLPVMMKGGKWIETYPENKLIEVDWVGAGCLLIRRDVLQQLPPQRPGKHWFDWRVDLNGSEGLPPGLLPLSEDFTLCEHARKHGFPVIVDTSIMCRHVGASEYTYKNVQPLVA
jgi:hypothetical protein